MKQDSTGKTLWPNRIAALVWRCLTLGACVIGLWLLFSGRMTADLPYYYTVQSNVMVAALFAALVAGTAAQVARKGPGGPVWHVAPWVQLGLIFCLTVTFLVFALVLANSAFSMSADGGYRLSNILLHYVAPLMAIADWVLFLPHGRVRYRHAALWLVYPAAYVAFCFARAGLGLRFATGSRFPYFFMDADVLGWNLLWICPLFFAAFYALGCGYVWLDRRMAGRAAATQAPPAAR